MAECPDGRTNRGTRSQFRIGLPGFGLGKGFYPINLGKIMDAGQSSQISSSCSSSSRDLISPCKASSHTLTVREYEQTIDELKKENFNLKLKLYTFEESIKIHKDGVTPNEEMVQVIVQLSSDAESLRAELANKDQLLQEALERAEKLESDLKELENINANLQSELESFSELPSKEEILLLLEEKENLRNHTESLENILKENEEKINILNKQIDILSNENTCLEEKVKKRSLALRAFVYRNYKDQEMLPDELKDIVISAIQAAKSNNKEDFAIAVKKFTSALNQIMPNSDQSEETENIKSPVTKCLKEESLLESPGSFHASQTESPIHLSHIQSTKEVIAERNTPDSKEAKSLDSVVHHSYIRGKTLHQSVINTIEKETVDFCDISLPTEENLISFSERSSHETCMVSEHNLIDIKTVSTDSHHSEELDKFVYISNENDQLKQDLKEKLVVIEDLNTALEELKKVHLEETGSDAFKASQWQCMSTQTEIAGNNLLNEYAVTKLQKDAKLSDNVQELREDVLLLLLAMEDKNKELSEVKESLAIVQEDLKKALNTTNVCDKDFYMNERNELHERLALSCSVNEELIKHLKNLEKFMEDLLQHKFDSSVESLADKSSFMSNVSWCLNESLRLSNILSDHLSVCEGSKLFEECESFGYKTENSEEKELPYLGLDKSSFLEKQSASYLEHLKNTFYGRQDFEEYISYVRKNSFRISNESDNNQLRWRYEQQSNPDINNRDVSHLTRYSIPKPVGYQSSDSDIWSEPDRNISMQRIGISLQNSPVTSKSPRRFRQKDKRLSSRLSSKEDTSSSECEQAFKKRQGSSSRRLFGKESVTTQDFALEKFYFIIVEKYEKLKSLMDDLESMKGKLTDDGWIRLNMLLVAVQETVKKLHFAKENAKNSLICGKCVMLELLTNLEVYHSKSDFISDESSSEQKILQEFLKELGMLKEACKEPFSQFYEIVYKKSISQSNILVENEQIKQLEGVISDLNSKNKKLTESSEKLKQLLAEEKEALEAVKNDNNNLLSKIEHLEIDLSEMKQKEELLLLKNEKLVEKLTYLSKNNSELNKTLKDLEQKRTESSAELDRLAAELQKNRSDLAQLNEKCLEYEKQLNEQIYMRENSDNRVKNLESELLDKKNYYLSKITELDSEKSHYIQELRAAEEKRLSLEKKNAVICDRLESKNNELVSLKDTIEKLHGTKDIENEESGRLSREKIVLELTENENLKLSNQIDHLKEELLDMKHSEKELSLRNKTLLEELTKISTNYSELSNTLKDIEQQKNESSIEADRLSSEFQKNKLELIQMNEKCLAYERELNNQIQMKKECENKLKTVESDALNEKKKYVDQLDALNAEKNRYEQQLKNNQEKIFALEKENAVIRDRLQSKNDELLSLKETIEKLHEINKSQSNLEKSDSVTKENLLLQSIKNENLQLSNQIDHLKEELLNKKYKEKEMELENKKLAEELTQINKKFSELNSALKDMEQKQKESSIEADRLNSELQKNNLELIQMNKKCSEYEKQLNEQNQMEENYENKLKTLESNLLSEKNSYLNKLNVLNEEKNHYEQQLKNVEEKMLALEKENAVINQKLLSKNDELQFLKETIEKLHNVRDIQNDSAKTGFDSKERILMESIKNENIKLSNQIEELKEELLDMKHKEKELTFEKRKILEDLTEITKNYSELSKFHADLEQKKKESSLAADRLNVELQKNNFDLIQMKEECSMYKRRLAEQIQMKEKYENDLKDLESNSMNEKNYYLKQLNSLNAENNHYKQQLKNIQEKMHTLENENAIISQNLQSKNDELMSLQKTIKELQNAKETLTTNLEETKRQLLKAEESSESVKIKNCELQSQINHLEDELSNIKHKEKELSRENEKLVKELTVVNNNNSKLNNTLKLLEQKRKDSNVELDNLSAELQKNKMDLLQMTEKCLLFEKQLNEQIQLREKYENELKIHESDSLNEKNHYLNQINDLNAERNNLIQELQSVQENKCALEKEVASITVELQFKNKQLLSLQKTVDELHKVKEILNFKYEELQKAKEDLSTKYEELHKAKEILSADYEELQKTKEALSTDYEDILKAKEIMNSNCEELQLKLANNNECLSNLQKKCKSYEELMRKFKENEAEYRQQLKQLETKSTTEKEMFLSDISALNKEKDAILLKLKDEKEHHEKLKTENNELNESYQKSYQQITTLKQRNEFLNNALMSSNSECDTLNKDLKCLRHTLQNLESKCLMYEKQLVAAAGMKDNLVEYLLNISNEFSAQRQKLTEMLKNYGNDKSVVLDETSFTKFVPMIDDDNVSKLCENIASESKKLSQSVDILLSVLRSYHLKSLETESSKEKSLLKIESMKKQMELHKTETEQLKSQNNQLQHAFDGLQKSVAEKEKTLQIYINEIQALKEKLQKCQKEIERENQLIHNKDDEITTLQERIFNLQTYVNSIQTDWKNSLEKPVKDSISSDNLLLSKAVVTENKMCQTDDCENVNQNADESFSSVSSIETGKNRCCERYWKKCYSLQTKLALCRKHVEILEKEKNDLKESLLQQLQSKEDSTDKKDSAIAKIAELESKLEKKKLFISDLKSELLNSCNALIDKEKEVDDLKQKLAEYEAKSKQTSLDVSKRLPVITVNSVDTNIATLKNHKWKLIQTIFDIQRKFYEKKDIHLNYFDRFKDHVSNLYSMQLIQSVPKSESMPLLGSHALGKQYESGSDKVKKIVDLELDIECLENLKIFLNRFLVPCITQIPEISNKQSEIKQKEVFDRFSLPIKVQNGEEIKHDVTDILNLSFPDVFDVADLENTVSQRSLSIDRLASSISQHLDYIQKLFVTVSKRNWSAILDLSIQGSVDQATIKSLLFNVFQEMRIVYERAEKLFSLNAHLKSFDSAVSLQVPLNSEIKQDTSDQESIMSEETIAVSRTESPLSFEDACPIKLPHPETLELEEKTRRESARNKVTVIEPYGTKMTVIDSSCDSVCQRSHYSSPDLGIESDPNHDSSAPEQKEEGTSKYQRLIREEQMFLKPQQKTTFISAESAGRWSGPKFGDTLFAVGTLSHFELLKQEIKESLVAIKSVLSRTGDGLHHIAKYTSPRKTLEYNTLKSIKDTCVHMEVCLKEANNLIGKFWTAPCPTETEWKLLKEENQNLAEELSRLRDMVEKQENQFKVAMGKLEHAKTVKDNMEKKISKKLVKTKKLIRQAELKLLETRCQNFPPVPKYPSEQSEQDDQLC